MSEKDTAEKIKAGLGAPVVYKFKFKDERPDLTSQEDKTLSIYKWGKKNDAPDFYVSLAQDESATHAAIIQRKVKMIAGQGWEEPETEAAREFLKNARGNYNLHDAAMLNASDKSILNHLALLIRWNKDKTKIGAIDFIPAGKVRIGTAKNTFWISNDWKYPKKEESKTTLYSAFSTEVPEGLEKMSKEDKKFYLNQVLFVKDLQIGTDHYAKPSYNAGLNWILTDAAISKFTLNMVKKNFAGGYHINIATGIPGADERSEFKKDFVKQYGGEDGDSIVITFSKNKETAPDFNPLPSTGNEDIYNETEKRASENVFKVHEVTNPQLFSIRVPGELGGKNELQESLEIFQAVYVDQEQEFIEAIYNKLAKINGVKEELRLKKYSLHNSSDDSTEEEREALRVIKALEDLPDNAAAKVLDNMSKSQILNLIGLKPDENGNTETIDNTPAAD